MLAPVRKRTGSAEAGPVQRTSDALTSAAQSAPMSMRRRGRTRSARFKMAEARHPATKPSWTEIVIREPVLEERCQSARSCGKTAEAENHAPMHNTQEAARTARARQRPGGSAVVRVGEMVDGELVKKRMIPCEK